MPGRVAVEKRLRGALKRGDGLALSRALDLAELVAYPGVALLERVAEALAVAEALDNEPAEA